MRASGVPCRMYSCVLRGMGQDEHFQNEYFVPGKGWVHVEPIYPRQDDSRSFLAAVIAQQIDKRGREIELDEAAMTYTTGAVVVPTDSSFGFGQAGLWRHAAD